MIRQTPKSERIPHPPIVMEEVTDPEELAQAQAQREQFDRNSEWFKGCADEVYRENRGKHVCVAGQEVFVADSVEEAVATARQAHPDDAGFFFLYIPRERIPRIYAHTW